ncbi:hypothetical protein NFHSH190041_29310 [Shewanella sp. NFH-SH190041]|uniref:periplasmic nitrate reductase, NapE protein n=1 Tax=Shewanella sp. NFH-SH190041 TaxID=2950245 RepID=UPI0021C471BB|nr:periplasmic nitrate reductase, NapE protein [Shewanella sp. NFH-SH190041]BDM65479.1 hypothetical protein NFHSH190041_29310 [Shewanella sp. NFH-SH190041]
MANNVPTEPSESKAKRKELTTIGFIIVVLFPLLFAGIFGIYGFCIWMYNMFSSVHS